MELIQDAREYAEVGRFRHVVIDARTALEIYVDQTLLACFRRDALSSVEAVRHLKLSAKLARSVESLEEAIQHARMNDKLKYGLLKTLGIRLGQRRFWSDWLEAKELRERSVHYGAEVPGDHAVRCLQVVEALVTAIHEAGSPVSASLRP